MIRNATINDAQAVSDIYNYFVLNTTVTFEEVAISAEEMARRIHEVQIRHRWLVYEEGGKVAGFTYAGMWKPRSAYRHTVEASIYIEAAYRGKGIGRQLYSALVSELESLDIHSVIGGIALPNDISIRLHESLGFNKIGQFVEVGWKFGAWVDVGYWELILK